jgi:hypothetical protein
MACNFRIEADREEDARWIAEIPELPGVLAYGASREPQFDPSRLWRCALWQTSSKPAQKNLPIPSPLR